MKRKVEMVLEYQNYIETPPVTPAQMYGAACSSDTVTIESWRDTWIKNVRANFDLLGGFKERGVGKLFGINRHRPAIVIGSGPSLGYNGEHLRHRGDILALSCLHNYHFFEDRGIAIDYYVTLDAGPVVLEEVGEGGKKTAEEYWESTRDKKLIAFIASDPELFKKWKGEIYLYSAPVPDKEYTDAVDALESFHTYISNGGNVLGACLYLAKGIMGSNPIAFVGADFSFGYNSGDGHRFHSWQSKYDAKLGNVMRGIDVFGNKVLTWPSYYNFKHWFEYVALQVPGIYFNCTEGGMFGAYPEGNLMAIRQMPVADFIGMYQMYEILRQQCENPETPDKRLLF